MRSPGDLWNIVLWDHWCRTLNYGSFSWPILCCPRGCAVGTDIANQSCFIFVNSSVKMKRNSYWDHCSSPLYVKSYSQSSVHSFGLYSLECYWRRIFFVIYSPHSKHLFALFSSILLNKTLHLRQSKVIKLIADFICFQATVLAILRGWNSCSDVFMILFV